MARRVNTPEPFTCVTCEIEIAGPPTFHVGLPFCCAGCVANGPCTCSYDRVAGDVTVRQLLEADLAPTNSAPRPVRAARASSASGSVAGSS